MDKAPPSSTTTTLHYVGGFAVTKPPSYRGVALNRLPPVQLGLASLFAIPDTRSALCDAPSVKGVVRPRASPRDAVAEAGGHIDSVMKPLSGAHSPSVEARARRVQARRSAFDSPGRSSSPLAPALLMKPQFLHPNLTASDLSEIRGKSPTTASRAMRSRARRDHLAALPAMFAKLSTT